MVYKLDDPAHGAAYSGIKIEGECLNAFLKSSSSPVSSRPHGSSEPPRSIDQLAEVARHHIELAAKIEHELVLRGTEFFLDGDVRVVPTPVPAPRPPPVELLQGSRLSVLQLQGLHTQLLKVAPEGQPPQPTTPAPVAFLPLQKPQNVILAHDCRIV